MGWYRQSRGLVAAIWMVGVLALAACATPDKQGGEALPPSEVAERVDKEKQLTKRCDDGEGEACAELAELAEESAEVIRLLERACEVDHVASCIELSERYAKGTGVDRDVEKAAEVVSEPCNSGDGGACYQLSYVEYTRGRKERMREAVKRGCDAGHVLSCEQRIAWLLHPDASGEQISRGVQLAKSHCDQDVADACGLLGQYFATNDDTSDDAPGVEYLTKGCQLGGPIACTVLGSLYETGSGVEQNYDRALQAYEQACDKGFVRGCVRKAGLYTHGHGVEQDQEYALELLQEVCDSNPHGACEELGDTLLRGSGTEGEVARAVDAYRKGCDAGDDQACLSVGETLTDPDYGARDVDAGVAVLERLCDEKMGKACNRLGIIFNNGDVVEEDDERALRFYMRGCHAGEFWGCSNGGGMLAFGELDRDKELARELFRTGCNADHQTSCRKLGRMFAEGMGVDQDQSRAVKLWEKACDAGEDNACNKLGVAHAKGDGVEADPVRAVKLYLRACELGSDWGCRNAAVKFKKGKGIEKNLEKAAEYYGKSCDLGSAGGCNGLAWFQCFERGKCGEEELRTARKAFELSDESGNIADTVAYILCARGEADEADEWYDKACRLEGDGKFCERSCEWQKSGGHDRDE